MKDMIIWTLVALGYMILFYLALSGLTAALGFG